MGSLSNNQVKAYELLGGIMLARDHDIYSLIVVGESNILIHHVVVDSLRHGKRLKMY